MKEKEKLVIMKFLKAKTSITRKELEEVGKFLFDLQCRRGNILLDPKRAMKTGGDGGEKWTLYKKVHENR